MRGLPQFSQSQQGRNQRRPPPLAPLVGGSSLHPASLWVTTKPPLFGQSPPATPELPPTGCGTQRDAGHRTDRLLPGRSAPALGVILAWGLQGPWQPPTPPWCRIPIPEPVQGRCRSTLTAQPPPLSRRRQGRPGAGPPPCRRQPAALAARGPPRCCPRQPLRNRDQGHQGEGLTKGTRGGLSAQGG